MATILLQVVDEVDPNFYINAGLPKRGDTILIHRRGLASFGVYYHNHPNYRIVRIRGTVKQLKPLMQSEPIFDLGHVPPTRQHRQVFVNPDLVVDNMHWHDIIALIQVRPVIIDPAIP